MANGNKRKRRTAQNGVQAIFTTEDGWKAKAALAVGLLALSAGTAFWAWSIQASLSLTFVSLAMLLVIGGVGLCAYSLAVRRTRQENNRIRSALYELEVLVEPKNAPANPSSETSKSEAEKQPNAPHHFSRTLAVALFEGLLLIIAYSGLIQEYKSNVNMQQWVQANVFLAGYALSYNALFVVAGGLLGAVVFQWRLGRHDQN